MTTIAYKDGIIAYDSLCVKGNTIIDSNFNKHVIKNHLNIFYCGAVSDVDLFLSAWNDKDRPKNIVPDLEAFIWDTEKEVLYNSSVDPEENLLWKIELEKSKHYSIGSGHIAALVLMDNGMTAFEALSEVSKRDLYTGGEIKTFPIW